MKKVLFLDRDGVINVDFGYVFKIKDFKFNDYIFEFCKKYQNLGYLIIIVTNQGGIAKKYYTEEEFLILNEFMLNEFKNNNINITKVYYCPHHSDISDCECRKPKEGLFLKAIQEFNIDVKKSIIVGDKISDLIPANSIGINEKYFLKGNYKEDKTNFEYKIINSLKEL